MMVIFKDFMKGAATAVLLLSVEKKAVTVCRGELGAGREIECRSTYF